MIKKKQIVDPKKIMYAHLARLTAEDLEINKLNNVNLRCTNESYIVGKLEEDKYGVRKFLDIMQDDSFGYLYFDKVSDAENTLKPYYQDEVFVIYAKPLTDLGITNPCTKDELKRKLLNSGIYFNFSYLDPENTMYANLAEFTSQDILENESNSSILSFTNKSYIAGQISEKENGSLVFCDMVSKKTKQYEYFKDLKKAYNTLKTEDKKIFVINAKPLTEIGINELYTAKELRDELVNSDLKFNFLDDEAIEKEKARIKK